MAGISLLLDILKRGPTTTMATSFHSHGLFSAAAAASAGAALATAGRPLSGRHLFGDGFFTIAYCDAGVTAQRNNIPDFRSVIDNLNYDSIKHEMKEYNFELKPLWSAFGFKAFSMTTLRSFLLYYLPLLEPHPPTDEDDDLLQDPPEEKPLDLVTPFQNSLKQIARETAIVTTRRVLERVAAHHVSRRTACKLLKDASKSAKRKAQRGLPAPVYTYSVAKTTFRAHCLGVAAAWAVQVVIEIYRCFIRKPSDKDEEKDEELDEVDKLRLFGRKVYSSTIKCGASLVFASIGAGIGALIHPSNGQWIGCALGDYAGPMIAVIVFEKLNLNP